MSTKTNNFLFFLSNGSNFEVYLKVTTFLACKKISNFLTLFGHFLSYSFNVGQRAL